MGVIRVAYKSSAAESACGPMAMYSWVWDITRKQTRDPRLPWRKRAASWDYKYEAFRLQKRTTECNNWFASRSISAVLYENQDNAILVTSIGVVRKGGSIARYLITTFSLLHATYRTAYAASLKNSQLNYVLSFHCILSCHVMADSTRPTCVLWLLTPAFQHYWDPLASPTVTMPNY